MALAPFVAATRITIALKSVTDAIVVGDFDPGQCILQIDDPENALAGTFKALHIEDFQMDGFRENLAILCPEIEGEVRNPTTFPLAANMTIQVAVNRLESLFLVAFQEDPPRWNGECLPADLPDELQP
ncbi:MAG: hypothetical protein ACLGJB_08800 [Blastocatellia bacterium]